MASIEEAKNLINESSAKIDEEVDKIIATLEGVRIIEIKRFFSTEKFGMNMTKRKLVEILEAELSSKINEQKLIIRN